MVCIQVYRCTLALRLNSSFVTRNLSFYSGWGFLDQEASLEQYIHKHGCGGGTVVLQWVAHCVCVCVFLSDMFRNFIKRLGTLTCSIPPFFLYLKACWPQFSVGCLWYAVRNLFTHAIIRARNSITSRNNLWHIILRPGPDRFCLRYCERGVKFRTLYPRRFFFFVPSLTVGTGTGIPWFRDSSVRISEFRCSP